MERIEKLERELEIPKDSNMTMKKRVLNIDDGSSFDLRSWLVYLNDLPGHAVGGEIVNIAIKAVVERDVKWETPFMYAGNPVPDLPGGYNISRRIVFLPDFPDVGTPRRVLHLAMLGTHPPKRRASRGRRHHRYKY